MSKLTLGIVIFTFIVFGIWFLVDLKKTKPSEEIGPELTQALTPLDPSFDQTTLQLIQEMGSIPLGTPRPFAQPTQSAQPTPSGKPTATPRATASPSSTPIPPPNLNFSTGSANLTTP